MVLIPKRESQTPWGLVTAGVELAGTVAILALLGWWLDSKWGTSPWLLLMGTLVATMGGIYNLWKVGKRVFKS